MKFRTKSILSIMLVVILCIGMLAGCTPKAKKAKLPY